MKTTISYFLLSLFVSTQIISCASTKDKTVNAPVIKLEKVRDLTLSKPLTADSKPYISAASGLIKKGNEFFLVSDNERHIFSLNPVEPHLKAFEILKVKASKEKTDKKVDKPDFESLAWLTPAEWPPYGAIVAWPSASTPQRMKAVLAPFYMDGSFGKPIESDILPLAYRLQSDAKELNMEGILIRDGKVFFFQRGNAPKSKNGIAEMSLANWTRGMKNGDWSGKVKFDSIKLGSMSGVDLTFSDADWTSYGLIALATAEDSGSAVTNGTTYGTVLVRIVEGKSQILAKFDQTVKLEGIVAEETPQGLELYLVDDSDGDTASQLFKARIPEADLRAIKAK